jgi:hypothetical protein
MFPNAISTITKLVSTKLGDRREVTMDYDFDQLRYRSDVSDLCFFKMQFHFSHLLSQSWIHHHTDRTKELNIKLSNNGFIYLHEKALNTKVCNFITFFFFCAAIYAHLQATNHSTTRHDG